MKALALATLVCLAVASTQAQSTSANSGTIRGSVLDPSGAAVKNASVEVQNPISGFSKKAQTDAQGNFEIDNVPFNPYHLKASATGFQTGEQDVDVKSAVPVQLMPINLAIGTSVETV